MITSPLLLPKGAAEVDVLNDILGDTVGHDEFQEELENTEKSTVAGIYICFISC